LDLPSGVYSVEVIDRAGTLLSRSTWVKRWNDR
jgi:hypothetical protein